MPLAPGAEPIEIYFARSLDAAKRLRFAAPTVVILPSHGTGNDFGNHFWTTLYVLRDQEVLQESHYLLMFANVARTEHELAMLFGVHGEVVPHAAAAVNHVGLFPDLFSYRAFVASVGYGPAVAALRSLGDAALLRLEDPDEQRTILLQSQAFHEGMLRQDGAYAAFRKGTRYLRRKPFKDGVGVENFTVRARLPCASNPYVLDFNFTSDALFGDRAAVLIGRNGVGKSQLLAKLVFAFTAKGRQDADAVFLDPEPAIGRLLVFSSVASGLYPSSIPPWEDIDYEYFGVASHGGEVGSSLLEALMDCRRSHGFAIEEIGDRWDVLKRVIEPLGLWDSLYLPLKPPGPGDDLLAGRTVDFEGRRYTPYARRHNEQRNLAVVREVDWAGEVVVLDNNGTRRILSSGEVAMLRFAAQACAAIELDTLILVDEPETHFHPNFVSTFMELLQSLLVVTSSVAIIATHSSYVVREVSRERVRVMRLEDGQVSVGQPRMQTFGASIDAISQFVFGDSDRHHRFESSLKHWIGTLPGSMTLEEIIEAYGEHFNPEGLSLVAHFVSRRDGGE